MKTKTIEVCEAILYSVYCKDNDWADIKCGGPPTLGYDFYVSKDMSKKEMINFIKECVKKYNRPFIGIDTQKIKDFPVKKLWDKNSIEKCIRENSVC